MNYEDSLATMKHFCEKKKCKNEALYRVRIVNSNESYYLSLCEDHYKTQRNIARSKAIR